MPGVLVCTIGRRVNWMQMRRMGSATLLHDAISAGCQILQDRLGDMCALVRRDPFVVEVRTAIALGIFDKGAMNCVRNQRFDSLFGHLASCRCAAYTTTRLCRLRFLTRTMPTRPGLA